MKKRKYILISNDDGIGSAGLKAVYEALLPIADVIVAAPDRERSGASHSISVHGTIRAKKVRGMGDEAYAISGTPADCAKLGLLQLAKRRPDLVISGVNHGPNISQFILYSGTVGAAAEAAILGIPAMAFSIDTYEPRSWDFAVRYIRELARRALEGGLKLGRHTVLNINIPDLPEEKIRGVKVLPKGLRDYEEMYKPAGKKGYFWHIIGRKKGRGIMTDSAGVAGGYVTVTPLVFDLNGPRGHRHLSRKGVRLP